MGRNSGKPAPARRRNTKTPAKSGGVTAQQLKRVTEAINQLTPKERKRLGKALKHLTPEARKQLTEGVKGQTPGKRRASKRAK
jgi:hypothetical protein